MTDIQTQHSSRCLFATVIFDVDSTLVTIEGIDWLASLRDADTEHECKSLTARAMAGEVSIEDVYTLRLARIRPTATELDLLSNAYRAAMVPGMIELLQYLHAQSVQVHLVSGGLKRAIVPLAKSLNILPDHVHAVDVKSDRDGTMSLLDGYQPLATQEGKPLVVKSLNTSTPRAMIGDGSTDAAVRSVADAFFAFTGVVRRDSVVAAADAEADSASSLRDLLFDRTTKVAI